MLDLNCTLRRLFLKGIEKGIRSGRRTIELSGRLTACRAEEASIVLWSVSG